MKQIWHITKKDLLCFRWPIAAWLLYLAVGLTAMPGWQLPLWQSSFLRHGVLSFFLAADKVALLFGMLFVLLSVSFDATPGAQAYWGTRPVRPLDMLAAKILGVLLIVVLPILSAESLFWLRFGFAPRQIADSACLLLAKHGAMLFVSVPLALILSLGKGRNCSARLALSSSLFVSVFVAFGVTLICYRQSEYGRQQSSAILVVVVAVFAALWICYDLYWRRDARGSLVAFLGLAMLLFAAAVFPSWNFVKEAALKRVRPAPELKLAAEHFVREGIRGEGDLGTVSLTWGGLSDESRGFVSIVEGTWFENGRALAAIGSGTDGVFASNPNSAGKDGVSLKVRALARYGEGRPAAGPRAPASARLECVLRLSLAEPREIYRLPVKEGTILGNGVAWTRFVRLEFGGPFVNCQWTDVRAARETPPFEGRYFLLDTATGRRLPISGSSATRREEAFALRYSENYGTADLRPWLAEDRAESTAEFEAGRLAIVAEEYAWTKFYIIPFAADLKAKVAEPQSKATGRAR